MKKNLFLERFFDTKKNQYLFFTIISFAIFLFSMDVGIFWDNVLFTSKIGTHLYENNLFNWMLPDNLDAGHPPTLVFLLAILWKVFGQKLWVSHLLILPFTIGFLYQLFQLTSYFIKNKIHSFFAFLLIIIDPTLSTQFVLVNPEIIQLFLFLLAINSILYERYFLKIVALFFLSIISLRSMLLFGGVFLFEIINLKYIVKTEKAILSKKLIFSYVIGIIPAIAYLSIHYIEKGWLISHANSPWSGHRNFVSLNEFLKNCAVLVHKYIDYGRFIIYFVIIYIFIKFKKSAFSKVSKQLLILSFSSVFFIIIASLLSSNPFGHRYFLISYILLNLLSFLLFVKFLKKKRFVYCLIFITLITGNLWIYPKEIAQGWDATLAHLPYYSLRLKAIDYLNNNKIEIEDVASFFPNKTALHHVDFKNDYRSFQDFNKKNDYVFYSNVYNLSDEDYDSLNTDYNILKEFKNNNIQVILYILKEK